MTKDRLLYKIKIYKRTYNKEDFYICHVDSHCDVSQRVDNKKQLMKFIDDEVMIYDCK
jgi:hypothetical protein